MIDFIGQMVIYNGVTCDGFVDSNSALAIGLEVERVDRLILSKNHYQLIYDPLNKNSYHHICEWLINSH